MLLFGAFSLSLGKVLIVPTKTASEEGGGPCFLVKLVCKFIDVAFTVLFDFRGFKYFLIFLICTI